MAVTLTVEDTARLKHAIELGVTTKREVKDLRESLGETLTELSKELNIPKKLLNQAISVAFKASERGTSEQVLEEQQEVIDDVAQLLHAAGK